MKTPVLFILGCLTHAAIAQNNDFNFQDLLPEKLDKQNIIEEEQYNVWGTNILKGKDGKYHAIYSRWPKSRGHHGWVTHSEIAHAVSDHLTGPYTFKNRVLPAREKQYWDGDCTHNPHVIEHNGKYYLYHMGNHGSGYWHTTPDDRMPSMKDDEWWLNRNNQRIGVAVADDLNGEWKRFGRPLVDIDPTRRMTSTPVVSKRPDGKFLMVYKYVKEKEGLHGGRVVHVTALSDDPLGPFEDTGIPFIETEASKFALDDHVEWFQNGSYYCIGKDHDGSLTPYERGSMVLYTSDGQGLHWELAKQPLVLKAGKLEWTDGSETLCTRTADMPKLYFEDGIPKALIVAVLPKGSEISFSVVIPLSDQGFQLSLGRAPLTAKFKSETQSIWGGSLVKGDDGLYHMFYSRWPKKLGWAWATHSEIAHAVATSPFGPFTFKDVALPKRGAKHWDGLCTHNPTVHRFGDKYYLYYMGNTGDGKVVGEPGKVQLNWVHRNNQRIGVALADSPNGPWQRFDTPLIDVSPNEDALDALLANNPSIARRPDGGYLMVYKAVGKKIKRVAGGPVVHCVATSDSPIGPFKKYHKPVFQAKGDEFPAEDPFIWYQAGRYRAIVKDMHGAFTDAGQSLVMFESKDGFDWILAANPLVSTLEIKWADGRVQKVKHLERPQLYLEDGKAVALLCASDTTDENNVLHSFNVQIPVKVGSHEH